MARIALIAAIFTLIYVSASAQSFAEFEHDGMTSLRLFVQKDFSKDDGIFVWSLVGTERVEIIAGPFIKPASWLKFGMGFGVESDDRPIRLGLLIITDTGPIENFLLYEEGGSGVWYTYSGTVRLRAVSLGILSETEFGTGPLAEFHLKRWSFSWAFTLDNTQVGLKYEF